jgi:hypothetical protein
MAGNEDFVRILQLHGSLSSQELPGRQDAPKVFGLAENSASILNPGE